MKNLILTILILTSSITYGQDIKVINYTQLEQEWINSKDTVYLINFWATWCKPCVEELPDFIKLNSEMKNHKFKMILVSLDFPSHIDSRVLPFIKKNKITSEVVILDDDANIWINKVDKNWDGAIPATLFINKDSKVFYSNPLNYDELNKIIKTFN